MKVYAKPGIRFPREDVRTRYVEATEAEPLTVPDSAYYRRAVARGDIGEVVDAPKRTKSEG